MAGSLDVRVLGGFCVLRDSQPIELPPSKKTRALLAYLAVTAQPHQRERLCELFWDVPDDPRGALRWSLSKIRRIVCPNNEPHLVADRNTVAIKFGREVDYHRISHLRRENLTSCSTAELEEAAGLLRGTFLADLGLPRCPDYEAWRVAIANEIEIIQLRVLQELTQRLGDTLECALTYAHALQRALPDNADVTSLVLALEEKAHRSAVAALLQPGLQHSRERSGDTASLRKPAAAGVEGKAGRAGLGNYPRRRLRRTGAQVGVSAVRGKNSMINTIQLERYRPP